MPIPQGGPPPSTSIATSEASPSKQSEADHFKYLDSFLEPGQTTTYPGAADSVLGDIGGFRTWLADRDVGFRAIASSIQSYDVLPTGEPRSPQRFNGQRFTLQTASFNFNLTWTLTKLGLPDTKLLFGAMAFHTGYYVNGPSSTWIRTLALHQTFFDGKLAIKAGITPNFYEYVGLFTGGSPLLASGVPGLLPIQAGLGADPATTPLINVTYYGNKGKYVRVGLQRSVSPLGVASEVASRHGPIKFSAAGAGPLYIAEFGVRRPASADGRQIWLRAGGFYNNSSYARFDRPGTRSNASLYALADRQITQPDREEPARGLYLGASAFWIPRQVNTSTQAFEARAYYTGLIPGRPSDTWTLRATWTKFSSDARRFFNAEGEYANRNQTNVTTSYSAHLGKGVYLTPSVSYVDHPSFIGDFKQAVILASSIYLVL